MRNHVFGSLSADSLLAHSECDGLVRRLKWLRDLAALTQDLSSVPRTHTGLLFTTFNPSSRDSDALF